MLEENEEDLIGKYLKGDEKSLEILIKRYLKPIYCFAYRYVGNSSGAEDITQDVFVKVWKNLKKFKPQKGSFKTWIFCLAKNASIDWLRKKKSAPFSNFENEQGENTFMETVADPAPLPNELIEQKNIAQILALAMERLSPQCRGLLVLRYNDHLNFREISEILGESLNTVKSRHRRALIKLKTLLVDYSDIA